MCILVKIEEVGSNKVAATTSLKIAEFTNKEHKNVLADIENIAAEFSAANFCKAEYKNRGKSYPMYILDELFTTVLLMGFNGTEAIKWKLEYAKAFQEMRSELSKPKTVKRVKGDEPSDLNRLVNGLLERQIKHRKPCHFDYSNLAREVNIATFGHHEKDIRQHMTEDEAYVLRKKLTQAGLAIADGLSKPKEIGEILRKTELLSEQKN